LDHKPISSELIEKFYAETGDMSSFVTAQEDELLKASSLSTQIDHYVENSSARAAIIRALALGLFIGAKITQDQGEIAQLFSMFKLEVA
jgi:hypothetical protein